MKRLRLPVFLLLLFVSSAPLFAASLTPADFICDACTNGFAVADFNGDGLDDLLSVNARELRFNLGGSFGPPVSISGIGATDAIQIAGDYNGDGLADVIARNIAGPHNEGPDRFLWGNGSGGFTPAATYPKQYGDTSGNPIDYDGDGKLDLALISLVGRVPVTLEAISRLTFLHGNGDGTYTLDQSVQFPYGGFPDIGIADFDNDGRRDLVLSFRDPHLYFYFAGGDGRWTEPQVRFTGMDVIDMRVADVNGDRRSDVVFSDWFENVVSLTVLFGDGTGAFPAAARRTHIQPNGDIVVGDLFPGGAAEIAYVSSDEGVVALTATGNELQVIDRAGTSIAEPRILPIRGRRNDALDLLAFGKLGPRVAPSGGRLILSDGEVPDAPAAPAKRSRAMSRGRGSAAQTLVELSRYVGRTTGDCAPPAALGEWSFRREGEGIFLSDVLVAGASHAEAALVDGRLITRLVVPDGPANRQIRGALTYTPQRISGYVRDAIGVASCGSGSSLRVNAQRSTK